MKIVASLLLVMVASATPAVAQVTTATLYGTVTDASGAVLSGAQVVLTEQRTADTRRQVTTPLGEFAFHSLAVGIYTLELSATGFSTVRMTDLELSAGQQSRRIYPLEIGNVAEVVEVLVQSPIVNSVSAEQRHTVSETEVRELPVGRRTLSNLFILSPGLTPSATGRFNLNGLGDNSTRFTVDGIDSSGSPYGPQAQMREGHNHISMVTLESVQEVQVVKGVFSAEYGRVLGGNINVITKSGTNEWHGSLFQLFNADELNARERFLSERPQTTLNQFGGSVGGRLVPGRAFIFGALERYEGRTATPVQGTVPTAKLRNELIAAVPAYQTVLNTFPLPNQPHSEAADTGVFIGPGSTRSSDLHAMFRSDLVMRDNRLRLTGTYVRSRPDQVIPRVQTGNARTFEGLTERVSFVASYVGGPDWLSETRVGYNRSDRDRTDGYWNVKSSGEQERLLGGQSYPGINALGFSVGGEFSVIGRSPTRSIEQKIVWNRSRHSLRFGGIWVQPEIGAVNVENPSFRYANRADLLANVPQTVLFTLGRPDYDAKATEWGLFVQDDVRVNARLTLNLGLRYDYFGHFTAHAPGESGQPPFLYNYSSLSSPDFVPGPLRPFDNPYDSRKFNLGPRIGFAYNPDAQAKTVVRGGFALMYVPISQEIVKELPQAGSDQPFRVQFSKAEAQAQGIKFPMVNDDALALIAGTSVTPSYQYLDPRSPTPHSINTSLTIERALSGSLALETSFVGTFGNNFPLLRNFNVVDRQTGLRPNPDLNTQAYIDASDKTRFYSWQTSLRERHWKGLQYNVHYTWGTLRSYGVGDVGRGNQSQIQEFSDVSSNWGPSPSDVTHRLVANAAYVLPTWESLSRPLR